MIHAVFLIGLGGLLALQPPGDAPEDLLIKAELLEISTGDLEKAMAAYNGLLSDEKAPAAIRARARLCLARCQRKRGEVEAARKNLEALINDPADREIARQAAGFLKELRDGRAASPDFDWLKEMEKNPEIQARVFELAMDLVEPNSDAGKRASRQLLAMGTLALPVVERVLETSRDPVHRLNLALIAVRDGRFERLAVLLDPTQRIDTHWGMIYHGFGAFLESIPYLGDPERKRLLETIARLPASQETEPWANAIQLAAGDFSDFPRKLRGLERVDLGQRLFGILESHPPAAGEMAVRILDKNLSIRHRAAYFDLLLRRSPASLEQEHFKVLEDLAQAESNLPPEYIPALEKRGYFDLLQRLASFEKISKSSLKYFEERYRSGATLAEAPAGWAPVLRKMDPASLHRLAEVKDEAIPEFVEFLDRRSEEAPKYPGYGMRADRKWVPGPRYAEAMAGLLTVRDPVVLAIALEALALAPKGTGPEALPLLEGLALNPPEHHLREFALYALLTRFSSRPETGPDVARILMADYAKYRTASNVSSSIPSELGRIRHSHTSGLPGLPRKGYDGSILAWVWEATSRGVLTSLFPHALALESSGEIKKGEFLLWLYQQLPQPDGDRALIAHLASLKTTDEKASMINLAYTPSGAGFLARTPEGLEFLRRAAQDPDMTPHLSIMTQIAGKEVLGWFDWATLVEKDDPILDTVGDKNFAEIFESWVLSLPEKERDRIHDKLRSSHRPFLLAWLLAHYPKDRPDYPALIEKAIEEPSWIVREAAIQQILNSHGELKPALLFRLLEIHEANKYNANIYKAIENLASPESIAPLVKLLDDPEAAVRQLALRTLTSIRTQLEEKKQWQGILEARQQNERKQ